MSDRVNDAKTSGVTPSGTLPFDPSQNVLQLVEAAIRRQDDLRESESRHIREMATMREQHAEALRKAETARIDAIRAVDVGAVNRAAEVSAQQATTLAVQVAQSAETLRTQVAAAATAATVALAAALEPIQKDIADLRRAQYEAQGIKTQSVEGKGDNRSTLGLLGLAASIILSVLIFVLSNK